MKILTVFDSHVTPDEDLRRFEVLAQLIVDRQPDVIVQGGDFASLESLSHWDKDKRKLIEGRRILADLGAAGDAWSYIDYALGALQSKQRRNKEKLYKPELVWMFGNHEDWANQYVDRNPEFDGMLDVYRSLEIEEGLYDEVRQVPWKQIYLKEGIIFSHAAMGRTGPVSSKYITSRTLAEMSGTNIVFGHTHRRQDDTIARYGPSGNLEMIRATNGGCFFEEWPHYAKDNVNDYWQGVLLLHLYPPYEKPYDVEELSLERMFYEYG